MVGAMPPTPSRGEDIERRTSTKPAAGYPRRLEWQSLANFYQAGLSQWARGFDLRLRPSWISSGQTDKAKNNAAVKQLDGLFPTLSTAPVRKSSIHWLRSRLILIILSTTMLRKQRRKSFVKNTEFEQLLTQLQNWCWRGKIFAGEGISDCYHRSTLMLVNPSLLNNLARGQGHCDWYWGRTRDDRGIRQYHRRRSASTYCRTERWPLEQIGKSA